MTGGVVDCAVDGVLGCVGAGPAEATVLVATSFDTTALLVDADRAFAHAAATAATAAPKTKARRSTHRTLTRWRSAGGAATHPKSTTKDGPGSR